MVQKYCCCILALIDKRDGHGLENELKQDIQTHLKNLSQPSAFKSIKINGAWVPVRNLNQLFSDAYMSFPRKSELSFSSFMKYRGNQRAF